MAGCFVGHDDGLEAVLGASPSDALSEVRGGPDLIVPACDRDDVGDPFHGDGGGVTDSLGRLRE
ncbi:hypothetical protein DEBA109399_09590 [Dermacoccus barathri]